MRAILPLALALAIAAPSFAHDGVMNKAVLERMETMEEFKDAVKILGRMSAGADKWDAEKLQATLDAMAAGAARIVPEFEEQENDPKDKAADAIWTNWDDFVAKAMDLKTAVAEIDASTPAALSASVGELGGACKACHRLYRER